MMVQCPMCKHIFDKEQDNYLKAKKKAIQELIEHLERLK